MCRGEVFEAPVLLDLAECRGRALMYDDAPHEPVEPLGELDAYGVFRFAGLPELPDDPKKLAKLNFRPWSSHFW